MEAARSNDGEVLERLGYAPVLVARAHGAELELEAALVLHFRHSSRCGWRGNSHISSVGRGHGDRLAISSKVGQVTMVQSSRIDLEIETS